MSRDVLSFYTKAEGVRVGTHHRKFTANFPFFDGILSLIFALTNPTSVVARSQADTYSQLRFPLGDF